MAQPKSKHSDSSTDYWPAGTPEDQLPKTLSEVSHDRTGEKCDRLTILGKLRSSAGTAWLAQCTCDAYVRTTNASINKARKSARGLACRVCLSR